MKKKMILLTMLVCPILIFGQAWDYPVKPGTEEWKSLKSHCEKISVCQIPNETLKNCSTEDLLEICLNYPLSFDFYAHNSLKVGIDSVKNNFNGLKELFNRKDNFSVLRKFINLSLIQNKVSLEKTTEAKGEIIHRYSLIECFLSYDVFINNASRKELEFIKDEAGKLLDYKLKNKTLFSFYSNTASALLLGKSIKKTHPDIKFTKDTELFLEYGELKNNIIFQELLKNTNYEIK